MCLYYNFIEVYVCMNIQQITNAQNFEGSLFVIGNYSPKPKQCIDKLYPQLEKFIKPKEFNLYIKQDYGTNEVKLACENIYPFEKSRSDFLQAKVPITAKASKYINAAKNAIDSYEQKLYEKEQQKWEQKQIQQKTQELKDIAEAVIFAPLYITGTIIEGISPKLAKKFEKLLEKMGL